MWGEDWGTMIWGAALQVPGLGPLGWASLALAMSGAGWLGLRRMGARARATTS